MTARLLFDRDVESALTPQIAVAAARKALLDAYRGELHAPPRSSVSVGDEELVFTAGGYPGGTRGVRVYQTRLLDSEQVVLVWNGDGRLEGCVIGVELGARRTGALGAVAADALARADASRVAVIGSGRQAWTQLWALTAVRSLEEVRVYSPTAAHRDAFTSRAQRALGLSASAADSARGAVSAADIIVLATRSRQPVIETAWLQEGVHVTTVGPKTISGHEAPVDLALRAAVLTSDSPAQAGAYDEASFTDREPANLGAVLSGDQPGRTNDSDLTLHISTGLAGSEIILAEQLLMAGASAPSRSL
jgi:ornithine cyclodeaminase/alanine dehydrogenase-like protein (mu-crystallin family)